MRYKFGWIIATAVLCLSPLCACAQHARTTDNVCEDLYKGLPFDMPKVSAPEIPDRSVNLKDFGGVGDGITLNTKAFENALKHLSEQGGGHLIVPAGMFLTGPITLLSNIDLHLEKNAIILFDPNPELYPIIGTNFEGLDMKRCTSPINALGQKNFSITGEGIIDGSGDSWRELKKNNAPEKLWKRRIQSGTGVLSDDKKVWFPDEGYKKARSTSGTFNNPDSSLDESEIKRFLRPVMVSIRNCERLLLEGCTFQNSPAWNIHPLFSKDIIIKDINVRNPAWSTNGDGIDIDACENVILVNSKFDVGDDAICIKSGKDADGRRHATPCKNLIIDGCTVYSGHGGFVVGSEMSGGVQNIKVSNCDFMGTDVGLRFKSTRGRGGVVRDIWIDNIQMKDIIADAIIFNLYYAGKSVSEMKDEKGNVIKPEIPPVDETTPQFRDIHIRNVHCNGAQNAININGLPEMPAEGLEFIDCTIKSQKGAEIHYAKDILLQNVKIIIPEGETIVQSDVQNLLVK